MLGAAQNVAGTADLQIPHGDAEAAAEAGKFPDGLQPLLADLGKRLAPAEGEVGIGTASAAPHPAAELIQLGKPHPVGVLYDEGVVPCPEPYQKRTSHGMILGENGEKMSKSRGNVVNPDDIVREYGADTLRTYEMFIGAFDLSASWSEDGVKGCRRFLERVWKLQDLMTDEEGYSADMETKMHQTIKKVSSDFENLKYNTAIAAMMALINDFYKKNAITRGEFKTLITLLNPVAPHITEELWQIAGFEGKVYQTAWPEFDEAKTVESSVEIAVQINGKTKGTLSIGKDDAKEDVIAKAKEAIADKLTGNIVKEIYVPGRIVNIVMR